MVYRYFCLTAHYRTQMSFSWESLEANATALNRLYKMAFEWGEPGEVIEAVKRAVISEVNDDLNFPKALAHIWDMVRSDADPADKKATLLELDALLGLEIGEWQPAEVSVPDDVMNLVQAREAARKDKDYGAADRLRDEVLALGFVIEDTREGPKVVPA
jgi:cysteinyl-tRNA synthetase